MASDPFDIQRFIKLLEEFASHWGGPEVGAVPWWWQAAEAAGVADFYVRLIDEDESTFLIGGTFVITRVDSLVWSRLWLGEDDPLYDAALDLGALSQLDDATFWR